jgi:hypothetical protein
MTRICSSAWKIFIRRNWESFGKWQMIPQKQVSAYRLALRNVVHTAFLALSMNSIIHVFFTKAYREGQSGKETERNSFPQEIEVAGESRGG